MNIHFQSSCITYYIKSIQMKCGLLCSVLYFIKNQYTITVRSVFLLCNLNSCASLVCDALIRPKLFNASSENIDCRSEQELVQLPTPATVNMDSSSLALIAHMVILFPCVRSCCRFFFSTFQENVKTQVFTLSQS